MDLTLFVTYGPLLLKGIYYTLYVCAGALVIGLLGGMLLCLLGQQANGLIRQLTRLYVTLFRGTPLLVQIYLVYYGGPFIGIEFSELQVGIGGLGLYCAAYFAEIFRAGYQSVPKGQLETAVDLGLSGPQIFWQVRFPQMLTLILPTILNQTILMVKESSILSVITVPEMTTSATKMSTETFSVVEPYLFLAVTYWVITYLLSQLARRLEQRTTRHLAST